MVPDERCSRTTPGNDEDTRSKNRRIASEYRGVITVSANGSGVMQSTAV